MVATLYFAKVVFIPLALALLVSFLLTPVVAGIERTKLPRGVAIFMVIASLCGVIGLLGWKTSQEFIDLTNKLPAYKTALIQKIESLKGPGTQKLAKVSATVKDLEREISSSDGSPAGTRGRQPQNAPAPNSHPVPVEMVPSSNPLADVENMLGPVATAGIILVFTVFMLLDRENLRDRFIRVAGRGRVTTMTQALDEASRRINRYLLLQMMVNTCYGICIGTGLYFIGIPNASLWGVTATVLRFLPYAGPPMAAAMPILLSLAVFSGWRHVLETAGLFFTLEVIVSNFIEPLLYGAHVGLSPLAILVAAIFWTMLWGIPGLLLATPLTVFLVVMGRYVPSLAFLNLLLGDEPVLEPYAQFYQRLLATEPAEAKHVLEQQLKEKPLEEIYSSVVIPALGMAEQDHYHDELDDDAQALMYQSIREMVDDLGENSMELPLTSNHEPGTHEPGSAGLSHSGTEPNASRTDIICVPARDDADDVVALMLTQLLERSGYQAQNVLLAPMAEMLTQVSEAKPQIVCISALPPFAVSHARALYRRLRPLSPNLRIVICLWHLETDLRKMASRLKMALGDRVFSTIRQVLEYVNSELKDKTGVAAVPR